MTFTFLPMPVFSNVFRSAVTDVTDAIFRAFVAVVPVSAELVLSVETEDDA
nr:MAG TPA_asm: hypothetical protein [Caudoviricetes sp.]